MIANFISHSLFHVQKISQIIYSIGHILFIGYNQSNNLLPPSWPLFIPLHHYFAIGITTPHRRATTPTPNNFSCLSYYPAPPNAPLSSSSPPMDSHHEHPIYSQLCLHHHIYTSTNINHPPIVGNNPRPLPIQPRYCHLHHRTTNRLSSLISTTPQAQPSQKKNPQIRCQHYRLSPPQQSTQKK